MFILLLIIILVQLYFYNNYMINKFIKLNNLKLQIQGDINKFQALEKKKKKHLV